ncbi:uncharacterized protein LOC135499004 isoform X2 [Lineus longissimus]|uniref:uncharacterized protein LOC135499004 isoform X2 n=1 Tax=Lineus longissimus TaxID=88925 RepID=UPI00315C8AAE
METETKAKITQLHNMLGLALRTQVTSDELKQLLQYFHGCGVGRREQENIVDFLTLWQKLETKKIIEQRKYSILEDAFRGIKAPAHISVIKEFEEKMKSEGGQMQLRNGTAKLQVPLNAMVANADVVFWIFRVPAEKKRHLRITNPRSLRIVQCSLPFQFGPPGLVFRNQVILTLKDLSLARSVSPEPMLICRKKDGGKKWTKLGSCFCDVRNQTATAQVKKFSSYVLGRPATDHTHLLNVHVLVEFRVAVDEDDSAFYIYFLMNDYSYVSEFVQKQQICVIIEACLYLDPQNDVNVSVIYANGCKHNTEDVRDDALQGLAEFPVQIPLPSSIVHGDIEALTLMQDGNILLRLPIGTTKERPGASDTRTDSLRTDMTEKITESKDLATDLQSRSQHSEEAMVCEDTDVDYGLGKGRAETECAAVSDCADKSVYKASKSGKEMTMCALHKRLALDLEMQLSSEDIKRLKHQFIKFGITSESDMDSVSDDILDLLPLLEREKIIEIGNYSKLKDALRAIGETDCVHAIEDFERCVKHEGKVIIPPHKKLASALELHLTSQAVKRLKRYFIKRRITSQSDMDSVPDDILALLPLLEREKIIELGNYSKLKDALRAIGETDCVIAIEDFERCVKHEGKVIIPPHKKLASVLEMHLTSQDVKRLKHYFIHIQITSESDMECVSDDILDLLPLLERKKIIELGNYSILKDALRAIGEMDCVHAIEDFEEGMKYKEHGEDTPTAGPSKSYVRASDERKVPQSAESKAQ